MLISFSGVDCAGKSTQIELLKSHLVSQGKTVCVFWYRPGYSKELGEIKKLMRRGSRILKRKSPAAESKKKEELRESSHNAMKWLWLSTAMIDSLLQWSCKLRVLLRRYDFVIADRFVDDAKLDLSYKYPECGDFERIFDRMEKVFPVVNHRILLNIHYTVMLERMREKNEPFPDPEKIRDMRYEAYQRLAKSGRYETIDASGTVQEVHEKILAILKG